MSARDGVPFTGVDVWGTVGRTLARSCDKFRGVPVGWKGGTAACWGDCITGVTELGGGNAGIGTGGGDNAVICAWIACSCWAGMVWVLRMVCRSRRAFSFC